jgi:hypothetical protein
LTWNDIPLQVNPFAEIAPVIVSPETVPVIMTAPVHLTPAWLNAAAGTATVNVFPLKVPVPENSVEGSLVTLPWASITI